MFAFVFLGLFSTTSLLVVGKFLTEASPCVDFWFAHVSPQRMVRLVSGATYLGFLLGSCLFFDISSFCILRRAVQSVPFLGRRELDFELVGYARGHHHRS